MPGGGSSSSGGTAAAPNQLLTPPGLAPAPPPVSPNRVQQPSPQSPVARVNASPSADCERSPLPSTGSTGHRESHRRGVSRPPAPGTPYLTGASAISTLSLSCSDGLTQAAVSTVAALSAPSRAGARQGKHRCRTDGSPQTEGGGADVLPRMPDTGSARADASSEASYWQKGNYAPMMPPKSLRSQLSDISYLSKPQSEESGLPWQRVALVFYAFAMPSGVTSAANMVGAVGWGAAAPLLVAVTVASAAGAWMLAQVARHHPHCESFGEVGMRSLGGVGQLWGNMLQLANFVLLLPVAQLMCADGLRGVAPRAATDPLVYTLAASVLCLLSTQLRSVSNASVLCVASAAAIVTIAGVQVYAAAHCPASPLRESSAFAPEAPSWFGNPASHTPFGALAMMLGATSCAWCYVPAFLTAELTAVAGRPGDLEKALAASASMVCVTMLAVGYSVTSCWGWRVANPVMATPLWAAELSGGAANKLLCLLLFFSNLVAYCIDSVCLTRACVRWMWGPRVLIDDGSVAGYLRYFAASIPLWLFGLVTAVLLPQLFTIITLSTFLTIPAATQLYPAACYASLFLYGGDGGVLEDTPLLEQRRYGGSRVRGRRMCSPRTMFAAVFAVGLMSFGATAAAAFGQVLIPLRK